LSRANYCKKFSHVFGLADDVGHRLRSKQSQEIMPRAKKKIIDEAINSESQVYRQAIGNRAMLLMASLPIAAWTDKEMFLSKVILAGCVADQPDILCLEGGLKVIGLTVMTYLHWNDPRSGEQRKDNETHRVVIVNQVLAAVAERLRKDDSLYIEGQLHTERWRDELFEWRSSTGILLWQPSDQLVRIDSDKEQRTDAGRHDPEPMLLAIGKARLVETKLSAEEVA